MKISIVKKFNFDCAHHLPFLPDGHKCRRLHGHTYKGEVEYRGVPDENGIMVEYGLISAIIDDIVDHRDLNDLMAPHTSTTENLVKYLWAKFSALETANVDLVRVRVAESKTTYAEIKR